MNFYGYSIRIHFLLLDTPEVVNFQKKVILSNLKKPKAIQKITK